MKTQVRADLLVRSRRPRRLVEEKSGSRGTRADRGVRPTFVFITFGGPAGPWSLPCGRGLLGLMQLIERLLGLRVAGMLFEQFLENGACFVFIALDGKHPGEI